MSINEKSTFNANQNEEKQYFIPVEMDRKTYNSLVGAKSFKYGPIRIGIRDTFGILVPATKEQYQAYMRPIWAEMKREERSRRCIVSDGKGRLKRCEMDCKVCKKMKDGAPLSLESFFEETELEFEDPAAKQCETILTVMLFEDLLDSLRNKAPELAPIFEMLYDGKSQRTIANLINKPQSSVNDMIKRMRTILLQHISQDDLGR